MTLHIQDLRASVEEKEILKGVTLTVQPGEVHAIMGCNGAGKTSLARLLAGHPLYHITHGTVTFYGEDFMALSPEERAQKGLFLSFQQPVEIPGVSNAHFLFTACNALRKRRGQPLYTPEDFQQKLHGALEVVKLPFSFKDRALNDGFSGGEKKRNEIVQMLILEPTLAVLDEVDSGLDVDALRWLADGLLTFLSPKTSLLLITHHNHLLEHVKPAYVHVMKEGKIVKTGDYTLAEHIEAHGYDALDEVAFKTC